MRSELLERPFQWARGGMIWPLQDILSLRGLCARINHLFIAPARLHCPHACNTCALILRNLRPPPPTPLLTAIHHTILQIAVSCKGQGVCRYGALKGFGGYLGMPAPSDLRPMHTLQGSRPES